MIFNSLSSEVIKAGIVSKLAFSLGFKMISTTLKAQQPKQLNFETGEVDDTPMKELILARRKWATFTEWADTQDYQYSPIEEIAAAYVKSSGKPMVKASDEILSLRAQVSGQSVETLKARAQKEETIIQAKVQARIDKIIAELSDVRAYANAWYNFDTESQLGSLVHTSCDIEEVLLDDWVEQAYEAVLKAQVKFWTRYNNWDDAELVLIAEDKTILGL